jgi:uncharacterized protein YutE (UPF0331/DUF86 family)/predicted nucleotidyltransferase
MRSDLCLNPRQFKRAEVEALLPQLVELMRQRQARAAYLFGSVLADETTNLSDLDIAVLPPPNVMDWLAYYGELYSALCQLFHADNIDVVLMDRVPLPLQASIAVKGRRLFDTPAAMDFEDRTLTLYGELSAWRTENHEAIKRLATYAFAKEPQMVERERVDRFTEIIHANLDKLQALHIATMTLEVYLLDTRTKDLSEHYLRLAIEATLDLGRHVLVKSSLGVPQDYREVGKLLWACGLVPVELGRKLERMGGMRNVLVHLYWDIDYTLLYQVITADLDTFTQTIQHIYRFVDEGKKAVP